MNKYNSVVMNYGFGVIESIFCQDGVVEETCQQAGTSNIVGNKSVITYLLTDSVKSLDINNRARIVHNLRNNTLAVNNIVRKNN